MPYRKLTQCEIDALVARGCEAEDWQRVEVADVGFDPTRLRHVRFSGQISLGSAVDLRDATICDCMVGATSGYTGSAAVYAMRGRQRL